jgi:RNA polymerase sigma-70 factor (ECF subfamily)
VNITSVLARISEGDRQAFAEVVETFQRPLFGFLGRMGLSRAVAAEVAQETFLRAWRHLGQYEPEQAQFSTWLFSIARNIALNELTRASRKRETVNEHAEANAVCQQSLPIDQVNREQSGERLRLALARLPLGDRTALALVYVQELSIAEIAALENTTVGALKTRLHRVKTQLRKWLEDEDE